MQCAGHLLGVAGAAAAAGLPEAALLLNITTSQDKSSKAAMLSIEHLCSKYKGHT